MFGGGGCDVGFDADQDVVAEGVRIHRPARLVGDAPEGEPSFFWLVSVMSAGGENRGRGRW